MSAPAAIAERRRRERSPRPAGRRAGRGPCPGSTCARCPSRTGPPEHAQRAEVRRAARGCGRASCRTRSPGRRRGGPTGRRRRAARSSARWRSATTSATTFAVARPRRGCASARSGRRARPRRRTMAGSSATPQTSLSRWAPASRAASATAGLVVSTESGVPGSAAATARITGTTRAASSSGAIDGVARAARGAADVEQVGALVDHPPRLVHAPPPPGRRAASSPSPEKRVGRHVEDPHHVRPGAPGERRGPMAAAGRPGCRAGAAGSRTRASRAAALLGPAGPRPARRGSARSRVTPASCPGRAAPDRRPAARGRPDEVQRAGDDDGPGAGAPARGPAPRPGPARPARPRRGRRRARRRRGPRPAAPAARRRPCRSTVAPASDRAGRDRGDDRRRRPCRPWTPRRAVSGRGGLRVAAGEVRAEVVERLGEGRGAVRVVRAVEQDLAGGRRGRGDVEQLEAARPARGRVARAGAPRPGPSRARPRSSASSSASATATFAAWWRPRRPTSHRRRAPAAPPAARPAVQPRSGGGRRDGQRHAEPRAAPAEDRERLARRRRSPPRSPRLTIATFSRAMRPIVGPSRSVWSSPTLVSTATPPSQALRRVQPPAEAHLDQRDVQARPPRSGGTSRRSAARTPSAARGAARRGRRAAATASTRRAKSAGAIGRAVHDDPLPVRHEVRLGRLADAVPGGPQRRPGERDDAALAVRPGDERAADLALRVAQRAQQRADPAEARGGCRTGRGTRSPRAPPRRCRSGASRAPGGLARAHSRVSSSS